MDVGIELELRAAVGAGHDTGFLELLCGQPFLRCLLEIQLDNAARPRTGALDRLYVSAIVADHLLGARIIPQVRPAGVAGEAVFALCRLLLALVCQGNTYGYSEAGSSEYSVSAALQNSLSNAPLE